MNRGATLERDAVVARVRGGVALAVVAQAVGRAPLPFSQPALRSAYDLFAREHRADLAAAVRPHILHTIEARAPWQEDGRSGPLWGCTGCDREFFTEAEANRHRVAPAACSSCGHQFPGPWFDKCPQCDPAF